MNLREIHDESTSLFPFLSTARSAYGRRALTEGGTTWREGADGGRKSASLWWWTSSLEGGAESANLRERPLTCAFAPRPSLTGTKPQCCNLIHVIWHILCPTTVGGRTTPQDLVGRLGAEQTGRSAKSDVLKRNTRYPR